MPLAEKKVLLVDDTPDITAVLAERFGAAGAIVETADNGETAIAKAHAMKPDIVLVDLMLPDQPGTDIIKALRLEPEPHPFFAILTNSTSVTDFADAMDLGVTTVIQKADHDPHEIVSTIATRYAQESRKKNPL